MFLLLPKKVIKVNKFIVFEGVDSSGKSTQIKLLEEKFKKDELSFSTYREPGGNILSEKIRDILLDKTLDICNESELMLFLAARAQNTSRGIKKELKNQKFVICDRYADSSLVYQGFGKNIDKNFINLCNSFVTQGIQPSITVVLDIEWEKSNKRCNREKDRMEKNSDIFFKKISDGYRLLVEESPERYFLIDGTLAINEIHNLIWEKVKKEFNL
jgi:dTMP kinase